MMNLSLSSEAERLIEERMRAGQYQSVEELILAGLNSLELQEYFGDFASGEWNTLLAESELSLEGSGPIDAAEIFEAARQRMNKSLVVALATHRTPVTIDTQVIGRK